MNRATSRPTFRWILTVAAGLTGILWTGLARAETVSFKIPLSGAECKPPVEGAGAGSAAVTYNSATQVLTWDLAYGGLSSAATQAHIHAPGAEAGKGVVLFWLSQPGSPPENPLKGNVTLTGEQPQQFAAGQWWMNLHSQSHPACEIRGQVVPPKG
jgi:hypothetical protein